LIPPPWPEDEPARLAALHALRILDTPIEERFERITRLARRIFGVPIALVSLVDTDRLWFKSHPGLAVREMPRNVSFCSHAILTPGPMIVPDAAADRRFTGHPLVAAPDGVRFYGGQPLLTSTGYRIGALCIVDTRQRTLGEPELRLLADLASIAEGELEAVSRAAHQAEIEERRQAQEDLERFFSMTPALFCILDREGRFRKVSPAWEPELGYAVSELTGSSWFDLVHPEDRRRSAGLREALRGAAGTAGFENRLRRRDGSFRRLRWSVSTSVDRGLAFATALDPAEERLAGAAAEAPPVEQILGRLRELADAQEGGTVPDLLELFLANTDASLGTLRRAAESSDLRALKRAAHKLRGSSATFGASRLAERCLKLETLGDSVLACGGLEMVCELEHEFALLKDAVRVDRHAGGGRSGGSAS